MVVIYDSSLLSLHIFRASIYKSNESQRVTLYFLLVLSAVSYIVRFLLWLWAFDNLISWSMISTPWCSVQWFLCSVHYIVKCSSWLFAHVDIFISLEVNSLNDKWILCMSSGHAEWCADCGHARWWHFLYENSRALRVLSTNSRHFCFCMVCHLWFVIDWKYYTRTIVATDTMPHISLSQCIQRNV